MLKASYTDQNDIPEAFRPLFTEVDGKWLLTGVEGVKRDDEVATLEQSMRAAKAERSALIEKVKANFGDRDFAEIKADLDKLPELRTAAERNTGDVEERVAALAAERMAPMQRELSEAQEKLSQATAKLDRSAIHDAVRKVAVDAKVRPEAMADVLMWAEREFQVSADGAVTTRGEGAMAHRDPQSWLTGMLAERPHWLPASTGGGAGGAGGGGATGNPWSAAGWSLAKQAAFIRENGTEKATQMAASAGSKIGAIRPSKAA